MKKFLSLALALLMMLPLAIGTSAGPIYTSNPKKDDIVTVDEFASLLDYWKWLYANDDDCENLPLYDYIQGDRIYASSEISKAWADYCDDCHTKATFYIKSGNIYCKCTKCGLYVVTDYNKKDNCDCNVCTLPHTCGKDCIVSHTCGLKDHYHTTGHTCGYKGCTVIHTGNVCTCKKHNCYDDVIDEGFTISPEEEFNGMFSHKYFTCELNDVEFYRYDTKVYWYCENCGRAGSFPLSNLPDKWYSALWEYDIDVYCSRGGDYSMNGSNSAEYGETRTITFEPDRGYVLYDVTVNGESYGYCPTFTLTVKGDVVVRASFVKESSLRNYTFTSSAVGNGKITVKKNGSAVDAAKFSAAYGDTVTYKFTPAGDNYRVKDVVVNGVSKGSVKSYTISNGITKDIDIKVTFEWKSPYSDVADNYLNAVEYVTEAGIMGYYNKYVNKNAFGGTKEISVKSLAAALAEMADVNEKLDTVDERIEWAEKNGIIDGDADLSVLCKVQDACDIVNAYLAVLEDEGDVDFEDFDDDDTAKENALEIGLVSEKTYKSNRNLTRYDLASICYLIVNLDVE
ncbi:MAG: hypothetical protein E7579_05895 [Ruminococcaceae bacterium]|nr:hypothetical protein [Oscillospiraceae bacterium]